MDREELARFLRRARERVSPADVGMPSAGPRRVPGLRREEVAALAGVSVDYIVRLEQRRGPHPTPGVLSAIARALQLSDTERALLFELAQVKVPSDGVVQTMVRASVHRLIDRLDDLPVMLISAKGDILAWNPMAAALLGDWSAIPAKERNIVWQRFMGDRDRVALSGEAQRRADSQSVASLRAASARYPADPDLAGLIRELRRRSPTFDKVWQQAPTDGWLSHTKVVTHPVVGHLELDCESMLIPDSGQVLLVYSAAPVSASAEKLALLRVLGTQRVSEVASDQA